MRYGVEKGHNHRSQVARAFRSHRQPDAKEQDRFRYISLGLRRGDQFMSVEASKGWLK